MKKQKYEVQVLGMPLNIQTTESEEVVRKNAKRVEDEINDLIYKNARITKGQALLFLALDYLSENEKLKAELAELKGGKK
ncbi:MAG: cell division protein ZapA [Clostridia bacterium]|nr:cell division protein ZapA [Clostridia bacterium]